VLLGQQTLQHSRWGWGTFVAAFCGGLAGAQLAALPLPQSALLTIALALGLLIAIGRPLTRLQIVLLSCLCGFAVALDSPAGTPAMSDALLAAAGTALGGILLLSYAGGLAARPSRNWQRIGVRIAGSWTAAAAGIVLAFLVAGPNAAGGS
jgi:urease accessory protein